MNLLTFFALILTLTTFSCSKIKNFSDMGESTKEINETSNDLLNETKSLGEQTDKLSANTSNMYLQLRLKEAEETRDRRTEKLISASSFQQKVTHAAVYFKAFEYQLWTGELSSGDVPHIREEKMLAATQEFFRFTSEIIERTDSDNLEDFTKNAQTKIGGALYALAVNLHQVDDYQKVMSEKKKVEKVHLLKMIKQSLSKLKLLEEGKLSVADLKEYEAEVLLNEPLAILLLKSRINMLSLMALTKVSNLKTASTLKKLAMLSGKWESLYPNINTVKQETVNRYLKEAINTKNFLKSIGFEFQLDSNLKKFYSNMTLKKNEKCRNCNKTKIEQQIEFEKLYKKLI